MRQKLLQLVEKQFINVATFVYATYVYLLLYTRDKHLIKVGGSFFVYPDFETNEVTVISFTGTEFRRYSVMDNSDDYLMGKFRKIRFVDVLGVYIKEVTQ